MGYVTFVVVFPCRGYMEKFTKVSITSWRR